jgi:hypothetical protein
MKRRTLLATIAAVALAGCAGDDDERALDNTDDGQDSGKDDTPSADVQLSSIGRNPTDDGRVEVIGIARNYGDATTNVNATIKVLDGETVVGERAVDLGRLGPDDTANFAATFDVGPEAVDGHTVTFS